MAYPDDDTSDLSTSVGDPNRPSFMSTIMQMQNLPPGAFAGFALGRGHNTILRGGWRSADLPEDAGHIRRWANSWLNPRSFTRFDSPTHHLSTVDTKGSKVLKTLMNRAEKSDSKIAQKMVQGANKLGLRDADGTMHPLLEKGIASRITAGSRLMGSNISTDMVSKAGGFIGKTNPAMGKSVMNLPGNLTSQETGELVTMSSRTAAGGYIGGFSAGARTGGISDVSKTVLGEVASGDEKMAASGAQSALLGSARGAAYKQFINEKGGWFKAQKAIIKGDRVKGGFSDAAASEAGKDVLDEATSKVGGDVAATAVREAGTTAAGEIGAAVGEQAAGAATRTAGGALMDSLGTTAASILGGQALDWIPVAGWVYGAISLDMAAFKVGTQLTQAYLINPAIKDFKEGVASFMGQIRKSPGGMGYRDTQLAATSRQRGVMAIQNSRLNFRSVLGSEAALLHSRYS